ncbi:MAG: aminopeptidase P family N-terminal domain-containing protein [Peptococcaceae bacterium]|nr:aminopeptidase P family N-terminal domain-containing protein [Peptococcaceae bacterium]
MRYTPKAELEQRARRLQEMMKKHDIDAAVIVQNADLFYFAGTVQQSHLFIPAEGRPVLMVKKSFERARRESALENVVPLDNLRELPGILSAFGHGSLERIGFELDVLPAALYLRYQKVFEPARLVDAIRLKDVSLSRYGEDLCVEGYVVDPGGEG